MWGKGNPSVLSVGIWTAEATKGNSMEVPPKIKNRTTIWSMNFTSGYLSEGNENTKSKRYLFSHLQCSDYYNSEDMETTQVATDKWKDKEDVIHTHTHTGIVTNHKK